MADQRISDLPAASALTGTEKLEVVQSGTNKRATSANFLTYIRNGIEAPVTLTDAATIATDASAGNRFRVSSATDRTLGAPTNPTDGQECTWEWKNTDSIPHTLTLASGADGFRFGSTITALTATSAGKIDRITAVYQGTDLRWDVIAYVKSF